MGLLRLWKCGELMCVLLIFVSCFLLCSVLNIFTSAMNGFETNITGTRKFADWRKAMEPL